MTLASVIDSLLKTMLEKRSFTLAGHRTSVALEAEFWAGLEEIVAVQGVSMNRYIQSIDEERAEEPLASTLRLTVLKHYQSKANSLSGAQTI